MRKPKPPKTNKRKARDFPHTDTGNAELLVALYADAVRYDHRRGRWLIWDAKRHRWMPDTTNKISHLAIKSARFRLTESADISDDDKHKSEAKWALQSENRYRLEAAVGIARSLSPVSDDGEGWDNDPWSFGVDNGIVDLRTGRLRVSTQQDRLTKFSAVKFDPTAKCPRFEQFLREIFNGDQELIHFIQKAVGYSLSGCVDEQCLFCCHGSGANGKSTLFGILHHIFGLGKYAANLPFSALESKNRNSNDLTMLVGARFVTAAETREDARLNEERIKSMTGGDAITAKLLYHNPFTFPPTHKLWLAFNHKPRITDDSNGMWRRMRMIPFNRKFEEKERDAKLLDKLKAETSGILAWAVRGCLLWQQERLGIPPAVVEATAAYQAESDHIGQFIEDCCVVDSNACVPLGDLWNSYLNWAKANSEEALPRSLFNERLVRRDCRKDRKGHSGTWMWFGIGLTADMLTSADNSFTKHPQGIGI